MDNCDFDLDHALYQKYIAPSERSSTHLIGVEFELPIVNLQPAAVDFDVVHGLTDAFIARFGFTDIHRDDEGFIFNAADPVSGDTLSYDCSYNTLEWSFAPEKDLNIIYARFRDYYAFTQDYLLARGHALTGMGINPRRKYNRPYPIQNGRYRMLFHHLQSYTKYGDLLDFHDVPDYGLFSCASQVQLDAEKETLPLVLNAFTRLEPLKALILANSPFRDFLCARDYFWSQSMHGVNPRNVGMFDEDFHSAADIVRYYRQMSMYCVEKGDKYINFAPTPLDRYFSSESLSGEYYDGTRYRNIAFHPEEADLAYLRSFKFEDVTFRGTIEFRSVCEQPVREIMTSSALHAGLMYTPEKLARLVGPDSYLYRSGITPAQARSLFVRKEIPETFDRTELSRQVLSILDLASENLKAAGRGEERYLAPLYPRAEKLESPAREMLAGMENGQDLEYYIRKYGELL